MKGNKGLFLHNYSKKQIVWIFVNHLPQNMFLTVLNTILLNISNSLSHIGLRIGSFQSVVITSYVVSSTVSLKRFDCITVQHQRYDKAFDDRIWYGFLGYDKSHGIWYYAQM